MRVLVLVKAAPVLTSACEETMCVAGVRLDGEDRHWVRLHPVPFRDLEDDRKFAKYQVVDVVVSRPRTDRRPESWTPHRSSIIPGEAIGPAKRWVQRRQFVADLGEVTMCQLVEANRSGSGPGTQSLAVVRPREAPRLRIAERDSTQLAKWRARAAGLDAKISLFDDPAVQKPSFEVVQWRFQYEFECSASSPCGGLNVL